MPLNDDIADALIAHEIGLRRLSNATVRKIMALLTRTEQRLITRLIAEAQETLSATRQKALLADVRRIVASVYEDAAGQLQIDLIRLGQYEANFQGELIERLVPVDFRTVFPSEAQITAAVNSRPFQGRVLKDWFKELDDTTFKTLRNTIRAGYVEGRTTEQIIRELRGTAAQGFKDGILETTKRQAEATVRTAITHTANTARDTLYKANSDLIKAVQWTSTLDGRTSAVCRARDGKLYPVNSGPRPPAHPNCRSATIPVTKSWAEMGLDIADLPPGTRASMNGQVAADLDYDAWLRRQPVAFQDDVLGVSKAKLFRAGLKMDRYVDRAGQEYTLEELRRREAEIWSKTFQS